MIIIRLAGGLGNQIFQLGAGLILAQKSGIMNISIDDSFLSTYESKTNNELIKFFDIFNNNNYNIEFKKSQITRYRIPKIFPFRINNYPFVSDRNFQYLTNNPNKRFMYLDGYFQSCLTQQDFEYEITVFKKFIKNQKIINQDSCIIHIRGGDFIKLGWNIVTPKEYYIKAIKIMQKQYRQDKFYIVTDDKDYSKTIFKELNINYEFIGSNMYEDFYLIGSYKYRILSSSTFAFWASALGNNTDSVVIAPSYWTPNNYREIFLPNEIRLEK